MRHFEDDGDIVYMLKSVADLASVMNADHMNKNEMLSMSWLIKKLALCMKEDIVERFPE